MAHLGGRRQEGLPVLPSLHMASSPVLPGRLLDAVGELPIDPLFRASGEGCRQLSAQNGVLMAPSSQMDGEDGWALRISEVRISWYPLFSGRQF